MNPDTTQYSLGEEIANSITHAVGAGMSIAALVVLVMAAASAGTVRRSRSGRWPASSC